MSGRVVVAMDSAPLMRREGIHRFRRRSGRHARAQQRDERRLAPLSGTEPSGQGLTRMRREAPSARRLDSAPHGGRATPCPCPLANQGGHFIRADPAAPPDRHVRGILWQRGMTPSCLAIWDFPYSTQHPLPEATDAERSLK
jgi:hypothetical protein